MSRMVIELGEFDCSNLLQIRTVLRID